MLFLVAPILFKICKRVGTAQSSTPLKGFRDILILNQNFEPLKYRIFVHPTRQNYWS